MNKTELRIQIAKTVSRPTDEDGRSLSWHKMTVSQREIVFQDADRIIELVTEQAIQEVLDILKAEGWVGVVYNKIAKLKEGKK